jgi:hypothetical protein
MRITQSTPIGQWCRPLEEGVEESFELGRPRPVRLERATTDSKPQTACQLHRSIDELGLPGSSTAFDHDGTTGSRAHLSEPIFDDAQLPLAPAQGQRPGSHQIA